MQCSPKQRTYTSYIINAKNANNIQLTSSVERAQNGSFNGVAKVSPEGIDGLVPSLTPLGNSTETNIVDSVAY